MMRIKQNGTILESDNPFVIQQWKKAGHKEFKEKQRKEQRADGGTPGKEGQLPD